MKALKTLLSTNDQLAPVVMRILLGLVMFPHGAQKLLGWFGGYGFNGTMQFFTQAMHIPAPLAFLAIVAEFFGPIALLLGLFTRVAALGITVVITVAALTAQLPNGFFMNWFGNQKGEGVEYSLLMIGLGVGIMLQGAGRWALDSVLVRTLPSTKRTPSAERPTERQDRSIECTP